MDKAVSVILPIQAQDLGSTLPYARLAAQTRSGRLWSGQSMGVETHEVFAALAGMGLPLQFGSAVTLMPFRHPIGAALAARSVAALSGAPYVAGIGPGAKELQRAVLGAPYEKPLAATREYAETMRALLDGEPVTSPEGVWPSEGMAVPPLDAPPVEIGLGVLRDGMARVAGRVADWAITWLTPVEYLTDRLLPQMARAAAERERPTPRTASVLHCVLDRPQRDRTQCALMSCERHVQAPHYVDMLERSGIRFGDGDVRDRADTMLERGVIASGTPDDVADHIRHYHEQGVDEVVLNLCGVMLSEGSGAAARDLTMILDAFGEG